MTIAEQARALCQRHEDGPAGCPACRALATRLQPVSEALRPVMAEVPPITVELWRSK
jgi:hypothetical protein